MGVQDILLSMIEPTLRLYVFLVEFCMTFLFPLDYLLPYVCKPHSQRTPSRVKTVFETLVRGCCREVNPSGQENTSRAVILTYKSVLSVLEIIPLSKVNDSRVSTRRTAVTFFGEVGPLTSRKISVFCLLHRSHRRVDQVGLVVISRFNLSSQEKPLRGLGEI